MEKSSQEKEVSPEWQKKLDEAKAAGRDYIEVEVDEDVIAKLDALKQHKNESYSDVLRRLFNIVKK